MRPSSLLLTWTRLTRCLISIRLISNYQMLSQSKSMSVVFIFQTLFIMNGLLDGSSITGVSMKVDVSMEVGGNGFHPGIGLT